MDAMKAKKAPTDKKITVSIKEEFEYTYVQKL